jgi:FixJ family two-component response regulator
MPGMSGLDVQFDLQRLSRNVPVIVVTGHDTPDSRVQALSQGARGYFSKPVDGEVLLAAIAAAVER